MSSITLIGACGWKWLKESAPRLSCHNPSALRHPAT